MSSPFAFRLHWTEAINLNLKILKLADVTLSNYVYFPDLLEELTLHGCPVKLKNGYQTVHLPINLKVLHVDIFVDHKFPPLPLTLEELYVPVRLSSFFPDLSNHTRLHILCLNLKHLNDVSRWPPNLKAFGGRLTFHSNSSPSEWDTLSQKCGK